MVKNRFSIAVIPAIGLCLFLMLSWVAAAVYSSLADLAFNDPFSTVWAYFTPSGSGTLIAVSCLGLIASALFPSKGPHLEGSLRALSRQISSQSSMWLVLAVSGLVSLALAKGPYLFYASSYLQFVAPQAFVSIANLAAPVAVLAAGVASSKFRTFGVVIFAILMMVLFAYSTRLEAAAPAIFIAGRWLAGMKIGKRGLLFASVSAVVLLPVPLFTRGLREHGMLPYWTGVTENLPRVFDGGYLELLGNIGFTAPIAEYTWRAAAPIPAAAYWASIDPGLGGSSDFSIWASYLRAHFFIPYSLIGEFAQTGLLGLFLAMLALGLIWRFSISIIANSQSGFGRISLVVALGLICISALYCTQYNTRSVARILWLLIGLTAVVGVTSLIDRAHHSKSLSNNARQKRIPLPSARNSKYAPRSSK